MDGMLFTERGNKTAIQRKENELIARGYKSAIHAHPFRLRVGEYTIQQPAAKYGCSTKRLIAWMTWVRI